MGQFPDTLMNLFWAYNVFWVLIGGYVLALGFRLAKLETQKDQILLKKKEQAE